MAQAIGNFIDRIQIGDDEAHQIAIGSSAYGVCSTAASTVAKVAIIPGFTLNKGTTIHIKFINENTATNPTLSIQYDDNSEHITTAKPIQEYEDTAVRISENHLGWQAGAILTLTYDDTRWIINNGYNVIVDRVKQTSKTDNVDYNILFSAGGANLTSGISYEAAYNTGLVFNPSTHTLSIDDGTNLGTLTPTQYSGNSATTSSVEWTNVQNKPNLATSDHIHGNIENNGTLQESDVVIASGDKLVITDASDNHLIARAITNNAQNEVKTFDGSTTDRALTQKGSFENIVNSIGGYSGVVTLADLGLANAMHFIGITTTNLFDYPTTSPIAIGENSYTPAAGDVVLCNKIENNIITDQREFVWTGNNKWQLLGFSASEIYNSNDISASTAHVPTWISKVQQATDGKITVERQTIGILPIVHGGTGVDTINDNDCIIVAVGNPQTLVSRGLKVTEDNSSNLTITNNEVGADITINASGTDAGNIGDININSTSGATTISSTSGAMTIESTTGALTISSTTGILTISSDYGSLIIQGGSANSNTQSILTLGNNIVSTAANSSEGKIVLYSSNTAAHTIVGTDTTTAHTHTLPNHTGWIVSGAAAGVSTSEIKLMYLDSTGILTESTQTVGSETQPVYLNQGTITALTFTPNRLYYSAATNSFAETSHYANSTQIFINKIPSANETINEKLYVDGATKITGITYITDPTDISTENNATDGALVVSGGATITKKVNIGDNTSISGTLTVTQISTLTGRVGIGGNPDDTLATASDWHILKIYGSTLITDTSGNYSAHIDILTETISGVTTHAVKFYPSSDKHGYIGLDDSRWEKGYFSNLIEISNAGIISLESTGYIKIANATSSATSSIELDTRTQNSTASNKIILTGPIPTIVFDTTESGKSDWIMTNTSGIFSLNNQKTSTSLRELSGTDNGFELTNCLYINGTIPQSNAYTLYIGGNTFSDGNIIPSLNNSTPDKTLGSTSNRWAHVYIGDKDTHGDPYTPVYWNNGVPTQVPVVQKYAFSIDSNETSTTISISNTYCTFAIVTSIVVDSGISYLNAPLSWNIVTNNSTTSIQISTTTAVGGTNSAVSGYILVATGIEGSAILAVS